MIASVTAINANVPIIVGSGKADGLLRTYVTNAEDQVKTWGYCRGKAQCWTRRSTLIPTFWPALYVRAQIFTGEGKYDLAIQDCNEALRQYPGFVEAALLRARINSHLGKYAEALKEFNYLDLHPSSECYIARALSDRAWFQATCPDPSFRNGQQAVKDAKAACSIMAVEGRRYDRYTCRCLCGDWRF